MLPSSGLISFSNLNTEMGYPATQLLSLNDSPMRGLSGRASGDVSLSHFHGKSNRKAVSITLASNTTNYVLNTAAVSGYVAGITDVTLTINSGVVVGSTATSGTAFTVTGFTTGDTVAITNNGYIVGAGGKGGNGNQAGAAGGLALSVGFATRITNNGTVGGGGGGGGGSNSYQVASSSNTSIINYYGGNGAGGGAGNAAGAGGTGSSLNGSVGTTGSAGTLTAGGGGASTGGSLGAAGGASSNAGGAAGAATSGNGNITWVATGTRSGALN